MTGANSKTYYSGSDGDNHYFNVKFNDSYAIANEHWNLYEILLPIPYMISNNVQFDTGMEEYSYSQEFLAQGRWNNGGGTSGIGLGVQYCIAITDENRLSIPEDLTIDLNVTPVYIQKK